MAKQIVYGEDARKALLSDIYGPEGHKIYARNTTKPASYIAKSAELHESFVADGCEIYGMIDHSVISTGCTVGKGAEVVDGGKV